MIPKIAIVGSNDFPALDAVRKIIERLPRDAIVVGAGSFRGIDAVVRSQCIRQNRLFIEVPPTFYRKEKTFISTDPETRESIEYGVECEPGYASTVFREARHRLVFYADIIIVLSRYEQVDKRDFLYQYLVEAAMQGKRVIFRSATRIADEGIEGVFVEVSKPEDLRVLTVQAPFGEQSNEDGVKTPAEEYSAYPVSPS